VRQVPESTEGKGQHSGAGSLTGSRCTGASIAFPRGVSPISARGCRSCSTPPSPAPPNAQGSLRSQRPGEQLAAVGRELSGWAEWSGRGSRESRILGCSLSTIAWGAAALRHAQRPAVTGKVMNGRLGMHIRAEIALECRYCTRRLAQRIGVSQRKLQRLFRAELACTPGHWLRSQRMQAARLMLESSSTVKEVAYSLGFRHESQFCRDFKQAFGCSPATKLAHRHSALHGSGEVDPSSRSES
jgi:AraC-like DNA-binding protein